MGFLDALRGPDINRGVAEYQSTEGAVLLDVRTAEEYKGGHIPGSKNIPVDAIERVPSVVQDKDAPVFVHCLSGARSTRAAAAMRRMGYTNVKNIGGINGYHGKVER